MRRWLLPALALIALVAFLGTVYFLYERSRVPEVVYDTEAPFTADIVKKTVSSGAVVPRTEIAVKPRVSGVIQAIHAEPGDAVAVGDLIAEIRVIPDSLTLNNARASLKSAEINRDNARAEYDRSKTLFDQGALSGAALRQSEVERQLADQSYRAAADNLRLIREGAASGGSDVNTQVRATIGGMVLDLPVEVGQSVIESNTFNEGTTVASIADMGDLIFQGTLDESEVGRVSEGMPLKITIGAFEDRLFEGTLEYIAPKGALNQGAVQFEIRAALSPPEDVFVRAGVSATADIVLDQREGAFAIKESLLKFDAEGPYVEIETGPQTFEQRRVELGLSDGINVEVLGGVSEGDAIKGRPIEG